MRARHDMEEPDERGGGSRGRRGRSRYEEEDEEDYGRR
jgi:hypothetical protein